MIWVEVIKALYGDQRGFEMGQHRASSYGLWAHIILSSSRLVEKKIIDHLV